MSASDQAARAPADMTVLPAQGPWPAAEAVAPPVLEVRDLRVGFGAGGGSAADGTGGYWVVDGLSYSVQAGRTLAIIGESGSGKTVSSRAVMGLLPAHAVVSGSARLDGVELLGMSKAELRQYRGPGVAMVFQDPARSLNPTMQVGAQVAEAIRLHFPVSGRAARQQALDLLKMVRLPAPEERYSQYPHQLSGGMRQRVVLAIALACHPKVLFADEATSALDVTTQAAVMDLLAGLQRELDMAVVMISHNLGLAANYADDVLVLYAGRAVEQGPAREVFARVRMPYTRLLLDAVPRADRVLAPQPLTVPDAPAAGWDAGCAFAPRCPQARDQCRVLEPALEGAEGGHRYACWYPLADAPPPAGGGAK